jgi:cysteinyl-tRNA synthetase
MEQMMKMYVCGPTVYDHSHIGHARTYMIVDVIHRVMRHQGWNTHLVMNITDIDDKIINKAEQEGKDWREVAKTYEDSFFDSMTKLGIEYPHHIIRVSEVIPQIISYIQKIIDNGFAYPTRDGSIYFDVQKYIDAGYEYVSESEEDSCFPKEVSEISEHEQNHIRNTKKSVKDFALWKGRKSSEVGFEASFKYQSVVLSSYGRPGWHIECSTMIHETLGEHFDLHFGGIDLKFPHHYNENVQANAFHHPIHKNGSWCDQFKHIGHLCIDGLKMSKSLKNFTTINEILKITSPNVLRWLFLKYRWSEPMNYSQETLKEAKYLDDLVFGFLKQIQNYPFQRKNIQLCEKDKCFGDFIFEWKTIIKEECKQYNFDIVILHIVEGIKRANIYIRDSDSNQTFVNEFVRILRKILDILGFQQNHSQSNDQKFTELMNLTINVRNQLRSISRNKDVTKNTKDEVFKILDHQRDSLKQIGIQIQDTKDNSLWFHQD